MSKSAFRTAYDGLSDDVSDQTGLTCPEPTLAQQQFADESDINTIVNKFLRTGEMPESYIKPTYGDFTSATDFHNALNIVIAAQDSFNEMPAQLRAKFDNDPGVFLAFMEDPANLDEAVELGLVTRPVESPAPLSTKRAVGDGDGQPGTPPKGKASKPSKNAPSDEMGHDGGSGD